MFIDKLLEICNAQAFSVDAVSSKSVDLGSNTPKTEIGAGEPMVVVIQVDVAADNTTGNETYQFDLVQDDNEDLSSPDIVCSRTFTAAELAAGKKQYINIPPGGIIEQYIGLQFDGGGTTPTVTVSAYLQPLSMIENRKDYAIGSTIL